MGPRPRGFPNLVVEVGNPIFQDLHLSTRVPNGSMCFSPLESQDWFCSNLRQLAQQKIHHDQKNEKRILPKRSRPPWVKLPNPATTANLKTSKPRPLRQVWRLCLGASLRRCPWPEPPEVSATDHHLRFNPLGQVKETTKKELNWTCPSKALQIPTWKSSQNPKFLGIWDAEVRF